MNKTVKQIFTTGLHLEEQFAENRLSGSGGVPIMQSLHNNEKYYIIFKSLKLTVKDLKSTTGL